MWPFDNAEGLGGSAPRVPVLLLLSSAGRVPGARRCLLLARTIITPQIWGEHVRISGKCSMDDERFPRSPACPLGYVTTQQQRLAHLRTTMEPRDYARGKEIHRDRAGSSEGCGWEKVYNSAEVPTPQNWDVT